MRAYVEAPDEALGPFDREGLRDLYRRGLITGDTRVWLDGSWRAYQAIEGLPSPRRSTTIWIWVVTIAATIATFAYGLVFPELELDDRLSLAGPAVAWGALALIAAAALALSERPPAFAQVAVLMTAGVLIAGRVATEHEAVRRIEAYAGGYSIDEVSPGTLRISGGVGLNLASDLREAMGTRSGPLVLELDSGGGLVEAALAAGKLIRERGQVTTRVTGTCASACVAIFAAGSPRQMLPGTMLGVHQTSSALGLPIDRNTQGARYFRWLETSGLNRALVSAARTTPPETMATYTAGLDEEMLSGILITNEAGEELTPARQGIWLARSREDKFGQLVLDAVLASMPDLVYKHGEQIRRALLRGDIAAYREVAPSLAGAVALRALTYDEPEQVAAYVDALHDPAECSGPPVTQKPEELGAVLRSAAQNGYRFAAKASDREWSAFTQRMPNHPLARRYAQAEGGERDCLLGQIVIDLLRQTEPTLIPRIYRRVLDEG